MALPRKEIIPLPSAFALFSPGSPLPALPDWVWLGRKEWSFLSGAAQVLWLGILNKPTLVTAQFSAQCPAGLAQPRGLFFSTLCPHSEENGEVRDWGDTQLTLSDQRDNPHHRTSCSAIKTQRQDEEREMFKVMVFIFPSNIYELP